MIFLMRRRYRIKEPEAICKGPLSLSLKEEKKMKITYSTQAKLFVAEVGNFSQIKERQKDEILKNREIQCD